MDLAGGRFDERLAQLYTTAGQQPGGRLVGELVGNQQDAIGLDHRRSNPHALKLDLVR